MTDATVVSLCRQYLQTWDNTMLPLLADRLEELGWPGGFLEHFHFVNVHELRRFFNARPSGKRNVTVPAILKQYGGEP